MKPESDQSAAEQMLTVVRAWQSDPKRHYWNEIGAVAAVRLAKGNTPVAVAKLRQMAATALEDAASTLRNDDTGDGSARYRMGLADRLLQAAADLEDWSTPCQDCGGPGPLNRATLRCRICQRRRSRERTGEVAVGILALAIMGVVFVGPVVLAGVLAGWLTGGNDRAEIDTKLPTAPMHSPFSTVSRAWHTAR